jgi:transglutaminase-like putative cysteine protease
MARHPDTSSGRQRLVALGAVAALAATTGFAFGRVFLGRVPMLQLVAAAVASVMIAGLCERRGLAVALLASAAGLTLALAWIVFPQTTWYGLPTLRTLRAAGRSLELVAEQAKVQIAPTPPLPPLLLAAVTAIWTAAFSTHALAIRAGGPLLAVLPSVALVGFADTVLQDGARPVYAIGFLLAALAVVFVDGLRRVRQWGPVWSPARHRRVSSVAWRGARRVALLAVLTAVLVPGALPGFRSEALVDFSTGADNGVRLDPFVSIHAQLERDEPVELFEVTAPDAAYWRLYSLDQFNGSTWSSSDPEAQRGLVLDSPARLPIVFPLGSGTIAQHFLVLHELQDPWLPMAHPAEGVVLPFGEIRYEDDLNVAVLEGGLDEGLEYTVSSRIVSPSPQELDQVRFLAPAQYEKYTFVPDDVDPRVAELAREWTKDATTPYREVLEIQGHFTDGSFQYTEDVEVAADADAMHDFLTISRRGFCQQFATTMAIMVRELGYPARVAVGYRPGTAEGSTYTVDSHDAHAWVEVYFPSFGWLPFEPTPGRSNPLAEAGSYLDPSAPGAGTGLTGQTGQVNENILGGSGPTACPPDTSLPGQLRNADRNACRPTRPERLGGPGFDLPPGFSRGVGAGGAQEEGYSIPYRWIGLGLVAAAAVVLVVAPIVKWTWRRRALRRSREPRELVLAAHRVFDGEAADLGLGRRHGETLEEHRARLSGAVALSDGHLARLASAAERAAYGAEPPTGDDAAAAVRDAKTSIADLRKSAGLLRRVLGTYRPGV